MDPAAVWEALVGDEAAWADVRTRYAEPHRAYHTLDHIEQVLSTVAHLGVSEPAVVLAAILHDVVYDPRRADNEEESARYAERVLARLDHGIVVRTASLIRMTASHEVLDADSGAEALLDADLAILGGQPDAYERYARAIRIEYGHVSDEAYRAGRRDVLERFLARPRIFRTKELHRRLDAAARTNLLSELGALRA